MVYLDWLQAVLGSNSTCVWQWRSSELRDTLWGRDRASFMIHLEAMNGWTSRCGPRSWSSEFVDTYGGLDRANLEAEIRPGWIYSWRPWSSEFGDALRGRDWASLDIWTWRPGSSKFRDTLGRCDRACSEAVIVRIWRCTWRTWSCELGSRNCASLDEYLEAVDGRRARCWDSIDQLVNSPLWEYDKVLYLWALMGSWLMADNRIGRQAARWSYISGSIRNHENGGKTHNLAWMLYTVSAVLGICSTWCQLGIMTGRDWVGWHHCVFCDDDGVVYEEERDGGWWWEHCGGYE